MTDDVVGSTWADLDVALEKLERDLISFLFLLPHKADEIGDFIHERDFENDLLGDIYGAMHRLRLRDVDFTVDDVIRELEDNGDLGLEMECYIACLSSEFTDNPIDESVMCPKKAARFIVQKAILRKTGRG